MPKRKPVEEDEGPDKSWMESYADAMTLLLAFFIMLFAFALVDEKKFFDFKVGMTTALGVSDPVNEQADNILEAGNGVALTVGLSTMPSEEMRNQIEQDKDELESTGTVTPENIEEIRELLEVSFAERGAAPFVTVDIDERGIVVRYDGRFLFDSGRAELQEASAPLLAITGEVLELIDNPIDIEGHTDDVPTGARWISNWELSSARASAVTRWLLANATIPPRQLAAVGMADTRPRVPNDNDENRAENRRVEVVVRVDGLLATDVDVIDPIGDPIGLGSPVDPDASGADEPPATLASADEDPSGDGGGPDDGRPENGELDNSELENDQLDGDRAENDGTGSDRPNSDPTASDGE